ncbi:hypothetical protein B9G55_01645 [Saccharibacillus sp. O16]|nr:hypothetical protein B9G55_01645 [Saccharibacillus sp. O16]
MQRDIKLNPIYIRAAILLLCLLFVLLPDVRFIGPESDAADDVGHSSYQQQHHYAAPAASQQNVSPDMTLLPLGAALAALCAAVILHGLHADSPIPILYKHRLLRPLKFRSSFLSFFRVPI